MNPKVRDLLLLGIVGGVGYFIWKEFGSANTIGATSLVSPDSAALTNLIAPVTGLVGEVNGVAGSLGLPTTGSLATSLDNEYDSIFGNNPVNSTPAFDSSGGNADATGDDSDDD